MKEDKQSREDPHEVFGADVKFPSLHLEAIPENSVGLRQILAGQKALQGFYARLEKAARGEGAFLARLLRRHWERRFLDLMAAGEGLSRLLGSSEIEGGSLPPEDQIEAIASTLEDAPPERVIRALRAFAERTLYASHMVPWIPTSEDVLLHFRACVEAEDEHLSVLDMLLELLQLDTAG